MDRRTWFPCMVLAAAVAFTFGTAELASADDSGIQGATPEEAIASAIALGGGMREYLGDCASTPEVGGSGNLCSSLNVTRESDGMAAYMVAAVPELTGTWYFLAPEAGAWRLVSTEHALCMDEPNNPPFPQ